MENLGAAWEREAPSPSRSFVDTNFSETLREGKGKQAPAIYEVPGTKCICVIDFVEWLLVCSAKRRFLAHCRVGVRQALTTFIRLVQGSPPSRRRCP